MPFTTQKNVNFAEDERVDVDDVNAISALKDADLRELMTVLMEPGTNGTVLTGFDGVGSGLTWQLLAVDSAAIDSDGNMLEMLSSSPLSVSLPVSSSCYIHAYAIEQDSDSDVRRFLNDIPVPPEEYSVTTPTRKSKLVGLYVTTNSDAVLLKSSFQTTAFISGKNRKLVALAACKTNGSGFIPFSNVDFRHMWMVSGNQIPALNGGTPDLPFAIGSAGGDRNVKGIRTMFKAIASVLRTISGATGQDWWNPPTTLQEVMDARTDLQTAVTQTTLSRRIQASKADYATVHPTVGLADYTTVSAALAAVTRGVIHLKAGDHVDSFLNCDDKSNLTIRGDGPWATKLTLTSWVRMQGTFISALRFENMLIETTDSVLLQLNIAGASDVVFSNCYFRRLGTSTVGGLGFVNVTSGTNIRFENCTFEWRNAPCFDRLSSSNTNAITLDGCSFLPNGVNDQLFLAGGTVSGARFHGCRFNEPSRTDWRGAGRLGTNGSYTAEFIDCDWHNLSECVNLLSGVAFVNFAFKGNKFRRSSAAATAPLFSRNAGGGWTFLGNRASSVTMESCSVEHGSSIVNGDNPVFLFTAKDSDFWTNVPSATAPLFNFTGTGINGLPQTFKGCRFFCGNFSGAANGAAIAVTTSASSTITGTRVVIDGCEFSGANTPDWNGALPVGPTNFVYLNNSFANVQLHVAMRSCHFHRVTSTNLPIYLEHTTGAGKSSYVLDYVWGNNADGADGTGTGVTQFLAGSTYRFSDTRYRMNTAGTTT